MEAITGSAGVDAQWTTGALGTLADGEEGTISFMGVNITIIRDDAVNPGGVSDITGNGATLTVNETSIGALTEHIANALGAVASISDSPINGFQFDDHPTAGLVIDAPEDSFSNYNQHQITVSGALTKSEKYTLTTPGLEADTYISEGAKAGLVSMIDEIQGYLENAAFGDLSEALGKIDGYINRTLTARSEIGAKVNRMDLVLGRIADDKVNFTKLQSELEDADMAEVYMNFLAQENVYRSSLSVGARIIQTTLLDYLR